VILLWGLPDEAPMTAVARALQAINADVFWVDQRHYARISSELRVESQTATGWIQNGEQRTDLAAMTGAYLRPYPIPSPTNHAVLDHAVALDQLILTWAEVAHPTVAVINRPSAMASNDSKPAQAEVIRSYGFEVPDTIVTTDRTLAEEFWERHQTVIYKSTSGIRSIANILTAAHRPRLEHLTTCPTQLQAFVAGDDIRVHTVGNEIFATRINCDATDYRYASQEGAARTMEPTQLPLSIAERCLTMAKGLGLLVAGIDLRLTPQGEWYCFEVNTSPAFSWFQSHTDQPIADAIARLLVTGWHE
jgi:glutathione synthase/RimK-type ligase-like ATP-grasp enzyme